MKKKKVWQVIKIYKKEEKESLNKIRELQKKNKDLEKELSIFNRRNIKKIHTQHTTLTFHGRTTSG